MKQKEISEIVKSGWVRRKKGFRLRFEKWINSEWIVDYYPEQGEKLVQSEVAAWETARKFAEVTKSDSQEFKEGDIVNVCVVDDLDDPIKFYGTNKLHVLNLLEHEKAAEEED